MRCPRCRDHNLVSAQCAPSAHAPGCTQDGHHEHHTCTKCGFAWIGEPPLSEVDDEGWEELILVAFDQIIGHRLRKRG
jgi:hypothetical protein